MKLSLLNEFGLVCPLMRYIRIHAKKLHVNIYEITTMDQGEVQNRFYTMNPDDFDDYPLVWK